MAFKKASNDSAGGSDEDLVYEPLSHDPQLPQYDAYVCNRCGNPAYEAASRKRIVLWICLVVLLSVVWAALISLYVGQHAYENYDNKYKTASKNIIDQFPIVMTDFQEDKRFMDADPWNSPFWDSTMYHNQEVDYLYKNISDSYESNPWNMYGNTHVIIHKDSPYHIPGGLKLVPLYPERDAWLEDYTSFISAYQHEMHCLGVIKHVLDSYAAGRSPAHDANRAHQQHCMEAIRHGLMCNPDLQLSVYFDGKNTGPFWGGQRHVCRDQEMVREYLGARNLGFREIPELDEDGEPILKVWSWPLNSHDHHHHHP